MSKQEHLDFLEVTFLKLKKFKMQSTGHRETDMQIVHHFGYWLN